MMTYEIDRETGKMKSLIKVPPYFSFLQKAAVRPDGDGYDLQLSEVQLQEAVANANGVPMQCPLWMRLEGEEWWLLPYILMNWELHWYLRQAAQGFPREILRPKPHWK